MHSVIRSYIFIDSVICFIGHSLMGWFACVMIYEYLMRYAKERLDSSDRKGSGTVGAKEQWEK